VKEEDGEIRARRKSIRANLRRDRGVLPERNATLGPEGKGGCLQSSLEVGSTPTGVFCPTDRREYIRLWDRKGFSRFLRWAHFTTYVHASSCGILSFPPPAPSRSPVTIQVP